MLFGSYTMGQADIAVKFAGVLVASGNAVQK